MGRLISQNMELRYISRADTANGETDFKGETSVLTTQERLHYLDTYAGELLRFFPDADLDKPVVSMEEAKKRLSKIKPQPLPAVRRRIPLTTWKWTADKTSRHEHGAVPVSGGWDFTPQEWRLRLEICAAGPGEIRLGSAAAAGFDKGGTLYYVTENRTVFCPGFRSGGDASGQENTNKKPGKTSGDSTVLVFEVDLEERRWNLYVDEQLAADFVPLSDLQAGSVSTLRVTCPEVICVWGVGYHRLQDSPYEPYTIETFLDEDRNASVTDLARWNLPGYEDGQWAQDELPIAYGSERHAGEDLLLRRTVTIDAVPPVALLHIEGLIPGGEIYVNGRLAVFVQRECGESADIAGYLKEGVNLIAIRVYADHVLEEDKMTHTGMDHYTGWSCGRMTLDLLPPVYISDVFTWTDSLTETEDNGIMALQTFRVSVTAKRGLSSALASEQTITAKMRRWFPEESGFGHEITWSTVTQPNMTQTTQAQIRIPTPALWTSRTPNLYQVSVELRDTDGVLVDDYTLTCGIRTVSQEGGIFRINGEPELLRAPLLFGARPPFTQIAVWEKCPPAEFYVQEMLMVQGMNANGLRMSVHDENIGGINDPRICEIADQMGIMLIWQTTTWLRLTSATNLDLQELQDCIRLVRNHPSIVIWQPTNHPSWKNWEMIMQVYRALHETILHVDPSRLISPSADSRRMRPRWDDGSIDFEGNACSECDPAWTLDHICRGNLDYILGYGNEWSALREWPHVRKEHLPNWMESSDYIESYINSPERAYFNFEHDEIIGQPNWALYRGKPSYHLYSYEKEYDVGSIGRVLTFDEWKASQAWQALGAYETIVKCRWLDYDGLSWCNLRGGQNTCTYMKSIVDYYGQAKLAYYAHRMAFQDVLALSGNVDMVYGPTDTIPLIVLNLGGRKTVAVRVQLIRAGIEDTVRYEEIFRDVVLSEGRTCTAIGSVKLPEAEDGLYVLRYSVLQEQE
ncbi:MAG: hypothetical protein IJV14_09550 [Lachnospiraceae bacterium]|nr:hypothetical protein [Lachnospiraceae bacterium]